MSDTDSPPIGLRVTRGLLQVQRLQQLQITVNTTTTTLDYGSPECETHTTTPRLDSPSIVVVGEFAIWPPQYGEAERVAGPVGDGY